MRCPAPTNIYNTTPMPKAQRHSRGGDRNITRARGPESLMQDWLLS